MSISPAPHCIWDARAALGEAPLWSPREQALYWVDVLGKQLLRLRPASGERRAWTFDETISSLAERTAAPGLIVTLRRGLAFFDPATGALQRLAEPEPERSANRFNDGHADAAGRYWAGTMDFDCVAPTGAWYRLDGDRSCRRVLDGYAVTNGPAWSLDSATMWFNDTVRRTVHAVGYDIASGDFTDPPRVFIRFDKGDGFPDGMAVDAEGCLWIARWGAGCITRHDPADGRELDRIALPASQITSVAFGGPGFETLYVTSARGGLPPERLEAEPLAGALFAIDGVARGRPAHLFAG